MKAGGRAVLAIGCVLAMAGVVSAWVPLAGALRPDGRVPITVALTETAPSGSTGDFFGAAVEAMTLWNAKLQRLQLTPVPLEGEAWYENGRNEVFFDVKMFDRAWPSGLLAVTATTEDRDVVVETDIIFNAGRRWSVYRGALRETEDLRRVMVHELGHLLGLGHPDDAGQKVPAIMNSLVSDVEGPTSDDEFGVRALYDFGPGAAPVILDDRLEPADVKQGAGVRLAVLAAGRGPLVYEWRRDGMPIAGATLSTLQFTAGLGDGGDYAVVVRNGGGSITSKAARVVVRPAVAPVVVSGSLDRSVEAGADTVFGGGLSRGDAPLRYEWRKNGVLIPGATDLQLGLSDVQFSDAGDYARPAILIAVSA